MKILRTLIRSFPRLRNFLVNGKLYLSHPVMWRPAIKRILRTSKAHKLGITIVKPQETYLYIDDFNPSSTIIDVGCGKDADLSVYLISRYGLKSYGVDPTLKHNKSLKDIENITHGKFKHVSLAVSSQAGDLAFYETLDHESGSFYKSHKNILTDRIRSYKVKAVTISGLLKHLGLQSADFIKLDIEGAEYELLNSMDLDDLKKFKQVYIEFHHHAFKQFTINDTKAIVRKICNIGFDVFSLEDYNYLFYKRSKRFNGE